MRSFIIVLALQILFFPAISQIITPYKIYKQNGRKASFRKMMKQLKSSDVILFGELHNNPICHWLQYEAGQHLISHKKGIVFGAEMFETDNQFALDMYLNGQIDLTGFDSLARLWNNYETDYAPLVDLARDNDIPFIATNIPRRYASMVYKEGFEVLEPLSQEEKEWIAPLPIPYDPGLPGYKAMLEMGKGHGGENLPKAQAIKDATMAHFIMLYFEPGFTILHFNGSFHSDNFDGIYYYLKLNAPDLKYTTISTVLQEDVTRLEQENTQRGDFIICIDENMTRTY